MRIRAPGALPLNAVLGGRGETGVLARAGRIVALVAVVGSGKAAADEERTWRWFVDCSEPMTSRLQVALRGSTLYEATLPLCHVTYRSRSREGESRILSFFFTADAGIFGDEFRGLGRQRIEGNVWEAGGDPDQIILGLSFVAGNQILLNTLHFASPSRDSSHEQAAGLTSTTSAFRRRR